MAQCNHHKICRLDALHETDEELCILHSRDPNKDKDDFSRALEDYRNGGGCNFSLFLFPDDANFDNYEIPAHANFSGASFSKRANFQHATFLGNAEFNGATFANEAEFSHSTFNKDADFRGTKFDKVASFLDAKFCGEAILIYNVSAQSGQKLREKVVSCPTGVII